MKKLPFTVKESSKFHLYKYLPTTTANDTEFIAYIKMIMLMLLFVFMAISFQTITFTKHLKLMREGKYQLPSEVKK